MKQVSNCQRNLSTCCFRPFFSFTRWLAPFSASNASQRLNASLKAGRLKAAREPAQRDSNQDRLLPLPATCGRMRQLPTVTGGRSPVAGCGGGKTRARLTCCRRLVKQTTSQLDKSCSLTSRTLPRKLCGSHLVWLATEDLSQARLDAS